MQLKWIFRLFLALLCGLLMSCNEKQPELQDTDGKHVDLKNKWVIINYWALWCETCIQEIPALNQFYQHNKDSTIVLYGVNYDDLPIDSLKESISDAGIKFPVLMNDPGEQLQIQELAAIPMTFILDPAGRVAKKIVGPTTEQSLRQIIDSLR